MRMNMVDCDINRKMEDLVDIRIGSPLSDTIPGVLLPGWTLHAASDDVGILINPFLVCIV